MSEKILKYGVVGMIRGASVASNGIKNPKCRLTAVCDKNPETLERGINMLKALGHDGSFEKYTDYDEMLRSDIDAVIVATEATNHVNAVIKALEAGKHVLSEIPSFDTVDEAYKLKAAVKAHPELKYMAAENCCYWAFIQTWKKMHEDGQFGDIVYAEGEYLHPDDPDKYGPDVYPKGH
nr:Gfo/Idh/MocA family oxidoreductase [Clostridia bacterium]